MNFELAVNRKVEIGAGVGLGLVGLPFLIAGGAGLWALAFRDPVPSLLALAAVSFVVGLFCVRTAIRMIFGLRREDGGVLSPFFLRIAALYFLAAPTALWFASERGSWRSWGLVLELGFYFSAAGACLFLANRRQHPTLTQGLSQNDA